MLNINLRKDSVLFVKEKRGELERQKLYLNIAGGKRKPSREVELGIASRGRKK